MDVLLELIRENADRAPWLIFGLFMLAGINVPDHLFDVLRDHIEGVRKRGGRAGPIGAGHGGSHRRSARPCRRADG